MKNFLRYLITSPRHRGGPNRLDYITTAALMPIACIGSGISRGLFPSTTSAGDLMTAVAGGILFGLTYLYISFKVADHRQQDNSTDQ